MIFRAENVWLKADNLAPPPSRVGAGKSFLMESEMIYLPLQQPQFSSLNIGYHNILQFLKTLDPHSFLSHFLYLWHTFCVPFDELAYFPTRTIFALKIGEGPGKSQQVSQHFLWCWRRKSCAPLRERDAELCKKSARAGGARTLRHAQELQRSSCPGQ